jgi:radical SAM protein with 4Fe4S-binding SPASM domain
MSYSKFVGDQGLVVYYNNKNNSLYTVDGERLSGKALLEQEVYDTAHLHHGVRHKSNKPVSLRILLGHACNYSCTYCMQKDIGNPSERPQNIFTGQFIKQVKDNLDLTNLKRIELWGGEPFLYWKDMMKIMTAFDREGLQYYMSTNGSALQPKHLEFFLTLKASVSFTISHDGPGHERLRGADILEKKGAMIAEWDKHWPKIQFSINPVLSDTNYDLFEINDYFKTWTEKYGVNHTSIGWVVGRVYDKDNAENSALHVIRGENLAKFKKIESEFLDALITDFKAGIFPGPTSRFLPNLLWDDYQGVHGYLQTLRYEQPITLTSGCGADADDIISLDLNGAVRTCPHTDDSFIGGHVTDIENVSIDRIDLDRKNRKDHCYNCPVYRICKSSCPIDFDDTVFKMNCAIEKTIYSTMQQKAFSLLFNQEMSLVDWGLDKIPLDNDTIKTNILQDQTREPLPTNN